MAACLSIILSLKYEFKTRKRQLLKLQEYYEAFVHAGGSGTDMGDYCNTYFAEGDIKHSANEECTAADHKVKCWYMGPGAVWDSKCDDYNAVAREVAIVNILVIVCVTIANLSVEIFSAVFSKHEIHSQISGEERALMSRVASAQILNNMVVFVASETIYRILNNFLYDCEGDNDVVSNKCLKIQTVFSTDWHVDTGPMILTTVFFNSFVLYAILLLNHIKAHK